MKRLLIIILSTGLPSVFFAQESTTKTSICEAVYEDVQINPLSTIDSEQLSSTAAIADYETETQKLKLTGTIYEADGVTPAKNVVLYIEHANQNGEYEVLTKNHRVKHSAAVKTDENGKYTIYTVVPGHTKEKLAYKRTKRSQHIHLLVQEPGKVAYELPGFVFDDDVFLTKTCRKRLRKRGIDNILILKEKDGVQIAQKDIILTEIASMQVASK